MATENKNIIIGHGLGNLKFGMKRAEVKTMLGEPDDIDVDVLDDEDCDNLQTESCHYDDLELSASFDEDYNWKLVRLAVSAPEYTLNGEKVILLREAELLKKLEQMNLGEIDFEDISTKESPNQKILMINEAGINFWLDNGVVSEIQWAPLFEDEDNIKWPE